MAKWVVTNLFKKDGNQPRNVDLRIHGPASGETGDSFALEYCNLKQPTTWHAISEHRSLSEAQLAADRFVGHEIEHTDWERR